MSQRHKVLSLLRHAGDTGVTNAVFLDWRIPRFSARICELREEGYEIRTETEHYSRVRYTLVSEPDDVERTSGDPLSSAGQATGVISQGDRDAGLITRASAAGSLNVGPDRLFEVEPERTHHYEEAA